MSAGVWVWNLSLCSRLPAGFTQRLRSCRSSVSLDAYGPIIRSAIAPKTSKPTISDVTTFYLGNDPLDTQCIPSYWRNLVYIREARWHLGIVLDKYKVENIERFNSSLKHQDLVWKALQGAPSPGTREMPPYMSMEVAAIVLEELDTFFEPELRATICDDHLSIVLPSDCGPIVARPS